MNGFLDYIEKYKFALLGTVLFHIFIFGLTNFTTMKRPFKPVEHEVAVDIPLEDIIIDPEMMKLLEMKEEPQVSEEVSNLVADQNDTREKSFEDFSSQRIDENVSKSVHELEQEYKDYWESQHEGENNDEAGADLIEESESKPNEKNDQPRKQEGNPDKAFAGKALVSYDLPGRKDFSLPRPSYTCNGSGKVVVEIKVDKSGVVRSAAFNPGLSTGATECMVEKSIAYAKRSRFDLGQSALSQNGTITYEFRGR